MEGVSVQVSVDVLIEPSAGFGDYVVWASLRLRPDGFQQPITVFQQLVYDTADDGVSHSHLAAARNLLLTLKTKAQRLGEDD